MLEGKRFTTVNTDAGVKNGQAAVAYWIRSENKWLTGSQPLKTPNLQSNEAELFGIIIALTKVAENEYLRTADIIVVNCDNQVALKAMTKQERIPEIAKPYLELINQAIPRNKVRYKWVKGHTRGEKPRNWVNNWCDKEVRTHYKRVVQGQQ